MYLFRRWERKAFSVVEPVSMHTSAIRVFFESAMSTEELPVLEDWMVRGANRYSGFLHRPGKKEAPFIETGKHAQLSRDGTTITTSARLGGASEPGRVYQKTYRLGTPHKPDESK
eukprot:1198979-Pleurochrysis_carterae.AAC.2